MAYIRHGRISREPRISLNIRTMVFFIFWFGILTFFLLAHVFLQFTIRDLRIEAVRLQNQAENLSTMESNLLWDIGRLNQGDRLHEYACTELGLEDVEPAAIEKITVPSRLIARYSTGGRNTGYEESSWAEAKYPKGLKEEVSSFIKINQEINAREQTVDSKLRELMSGTEDKKVGKEANSPDKNKNL